MVARSRSRRSRRLLLAVVAATLIAGCSEDERSFAQFDGPVDVAVIQPGIFEVPIAFVSNFRSGRVTKLDLKRTSVLVEDSPAPWMPGSDIAFGAERALSEIVAVVGDDFIDVWVADDFSDELLRAPFVDGLDDDGKPIFIRPTRTEVTFHDADGVLLDGEVAPELRSLRIRPGRASTEEWTVTWNGRAFEVWGSASGPQNRLALPGTEYESDRGELAFVAALGAFPIQKGESLRFQTLNGVDAADAGGLVTGLWFDSEARLVFATVLPDQGGGFVSVWDADAFVEVDRLPLGLDSAPESVAPGRDPGVVWVADSAEAADGTGRIFRLDYVPGDLDTLAATALTVPEPAIDVAEGRDPGPGRLFVASAFTDAIWSLDPTSGEAMDLNPVTPAADPTHVGAVVSGLAASPEPIETGELDQDGTRLTTYGVMATTFAGEMYFLDGATGCQVFGSPAEAFLDVTGDLVSAVWTDVGFESNPQVVFDEAAERIVTTHPCGGVSRSERWTFEFDEVSQSYEVEGSRSGIQDGPAFEGARYFTDNGSLSVLIMPGTQPTTDGDRWTFPINDGVTPIPLHELPGDPVLYTELFDDRTGEWWRVRERQIAVVPHVSNDVVLWIDIQGQGLGGGGLRVFQ